jgi:NitT/TauT family transport system ATP-binding protein
MALCIDGITHHYGALPVLKNISFNIQEGEFVCIIGPSGCGKTTLLRIIADLLPSSGGQILFNGGRILAERGEIGYVFQENALFPWMTVGQNVDFHLEVRGIQRKKRKSIVEKYLNLVGLAKFQDYYPKSLSGGMKQRLALARVLAYQPKIILMDEPFVALDAQTRNSLQEQLLGLWAREKKTILFITHNFDEAVFMADRIVIFTARPAQVREIIHVNLLRPRKRTSPEVCTYRDRLFDILAEEIARDKNGNLR